MLKRSGDILQFAAIRMGKVATTFEWASRSQHDGLFGVPGKREIIMQGLMLRFLPTRDTDILVSKSEQVELLGLGSLRDGSLKI